MPDGFSKEFQVTQKEISLGSISSGDTQLIAISIQVTKELSVLAVNNGQFQLEIHITGQVPLHRVQINKDMAIHWNHPTF